MRPLFTYQTQQEGRLALEGLKADLKLTSSRATFLSPLSLHFGGSPAVTRGGDEQEERRGNPLPTASFLPEAASTWGRRKDSTLSHSGLKVTAGLLVS